MAQKRSTCESHVNESQRLRMLDHHLSRMTRTHANWVVIALYGKGQMEPNAAVQGVWQGVGWSRFAVPWPFWIQ